MASSDEIGGGNGMESLAMSRYSTSSRPHAQNNSDSSQSRYYGVPAFDGDLMGRGQNSNHQPSSIFSNISYQRTLSLINYSLVSVTSPL